MDAPSPLTRPPEAARRERLPRQAGLWLSVPIILLAALAAARPQSWLPKFHAAEPQVVVYAYRQWQSTGLKIEPGSRLTIRARGEWSYSPVVGLNGPEGARPSPPSYPMPHVPGGALLGRIGEEGAPFVIGRYTVQYATEGGFLFLRINDDLLGDNAGQLAPEIRVEAPEPTPAP